MPKSFWKSIVALGATTGIISVPVLSSSFGAVANAATAPNLPHSMTMVSPQVLAQSKHLGKLASSKAWHFDIVLPSRNPGGLKAFDHAVNTPGSPEYHHYLSHRQMARQFGANARVANSMRHYLKKLGLKVKVSGQMLVVSGTVAQVNQLFHTQLGRYQYKGRQFVAPDSTILIPAPLRGAMSFAGVYSAMPHPTATGKKFTASRVIKNTPGTVRTKSASSGTTTTASSGGMTVTAKLLSNGSRTPGMAVRYLITATYNGQPDTSASYSGLSGSYQGASSLVDSSLTNGNGQFLVDFSLSQAQKVSLNLTVSDGQHQVTVPLPAATFSGPSALTTSSLTLFGVPGQILAPWNPSSNPVTRAFGGTVLSGEPQVHGPAKLAVYTLGNVTSISQTDVTHFAAQFGLPQPHVSVAYSGPNSCTAATCSNYMLPIEEELSLDLQMMETSAPGSNIQIYEAGSLRSALNQVISQSTANVFSISYGEGEIPEYQYFRTAQHSWDMLAQQANAQGITITVSAGDSGGYEGALEGNNQAMLSYPSNSANVSSLGGLETSINPLGTINQNAMWGGNLGAEVSKSTLLSFLSQENMMAGGGYSLLVKRPQYQKAFVPPTLGRANPDLSFPASVVTPGYFAYFANAPFLFGGTSASAPLFAGFVGDMNLAMGHRLGNVNPTLYSLATTKSSPFLPVAYGNNGAYGVTPGVYNPATGLGPVDFNKLLSDWEGIR